MPSNIILNNIISNYVLGNISTYSEELSATDSIMLHHEKHR